VSEAGYPPPESVRTVAIVGTGVIGVGWAAHFLRMGYDVVAWDPGAGAAERLAAFVGSAWPVLERLGLSPAASPDRLRLAGSLAEATAGAEFVQDGIHGLGGARPARHPGVHGGAAEASRAPHGEAGQGIWVLHEAADRALGQAEVGAQGGDVEVRGLHS